VRALPPPTPPPTPGTPEGSTIKFGEAGALSFETTSGDISSAQITTILARLTALEQENVKLKQKVQALEAVDANLLSTTTTTTTITATTITTTMWEPDVVKEARANGMLTEDGTYNSNPNINSDEKLEKMRPLLERITRVNSGISFTGLSSTTTLAGVMPKLIWVYGGLIIKHNGALLDFDGAFPALQTCARVHIVNNTALMRIDGAFPSWVSKRDGLVPEFVLIAQNAALVSMDGAFPILTSVEQLQINYNDKLVSVATAFVKLTFIGGSSADGLVIYINAALVDLPGFEQEVEYAAKSIRLQNNPKLASLAGLHQFKFTHPDGTDLNVEIENDSLSQETICGFWNAVKARGTPPQKPAIC
jgi:hypothetical protein